MVGISPDMAGNALGVSMILAIVSIAYSIYMAILNRKQAKVKELIEEQNITLLAVRNELRRIYNEIKK